MNILHVITGLPKAAGTSVFCAEVSNALVGQGNQITIAVVDPTRVDCYPLDPRVKLIRLESLVNGSDGSISPSAFDIVHIHALWTPILHKARFWATKNGLPIVWSPHGMLAPWAMKHKWWKKFLPWCLYQKGDLKKASLIHVTSDQEKQWVRNLGFTQPIIVAPLGTKITPLKQSEDKPIKTLLYVGRIYPVKALDRLIKAFALVPLELRKTWKLRLVGPDQAGHMTELKVLVDELHLKESVEFPGTRYGEELDDEYNACECLALVSHTENFGATVVDAMAHGKPVIVSDKTPWKEVAEHKCGWRTSNESGPLARVIGEMMSLSSEARFNMGVNGRHLVETKYSWSAVVKMMVCSYEQCL